MTIEVRLREWSEATEVMLSGVAEPGVLALMGEALGGVGRRDKPIILNLDELTLLDRGAFDALVHPLTPAGGFSAELAVVCGRPTGAELLRRWGLDREVRIYRTIDAALARTAPEPSAPGRGDLQPTPTADSLRSA
jgi:hypothetical protein